MLKFKLIHRHQFDISFLAGVNLELIEIQLKKRWASEYKWGRKQADIWDSQTNFIYTIADFDVVVARIYNKFNTHRKYEDLRNYAINRWYNFQSARAVEQVFNLHSKVLRVKNDKDREVQLSMYDILGQNNNVAQNFYDSYYEETNSNVLTCYVMLSFPIISGSLEIVRIRWKSSDGIALVNNY